MWLNCIFVALYLIESVELVDKPQTPEGTTLLQNGNTIDDDLDNYKPFYLNSSDMFDWQLLKAFESPDYKNVILSPLSIKIVLAMLYEGTSGATEKEFQNVLQFSTNKSEVTEKFSRILADLRQGGKDEILSVGTRLFLESSLEPKSQYASKLKSAYDADILPINLVNKPEASQLINKWIGEVTLGRIKDIITPEELDDILLIVTNAIFFKGTWRHQFLKEYTHTRGFYVTPTNIVNVPYMTNTESYLYGESKELDAKILRLPYKGKHLALFVLLPNTKSGLQSLIRTINLRSLQEQLHLLDNVTVEVIIPKFKFDFNVRLSKILRNMGLQEMFQNTAIFSGIAKGVGTGTTRLFVNDIKQKAGIEINEEGSTIYAATDIQLGNKFGDTNFTFNASHPFLFFIEDQRTRSVLFMGKVSNPLDTEEVPLPSRFGEEAEVPSTTTPGIAAQQPSKGGVISSVPVDNTISSRFNYFDIELLQTSDGAENYFISPASIKSTLGMILEGARGKCAEEIGKVLRIYINQKGSREKLQNLLYDLNVRNGVTILESANAIFVSDRFEVVPEFRRNLQQYYKADVNSLDFSNNSYAAFLINNWVKDHTHGLIRQIIGPENFNSDASIIITNALYFKGLWKKEFDEKRTSLKCFQTERSGCRNVPMMHTLETFDYRFIDDLDAQALQLPYSDDKYAMLILLPSLKHTLDGLIRDLQHYPFASILNQLEPNEVSVVLPKFQIEYTADVVPALRALGIMQIFDRSANLSGILNQPSISISNIVHKAWIDVNEKGTEAAAASGAVVIPLMGSSMIHFVADHPFLFFIYHVETKNILFEGRLNDLPSVADPLNDNKQGPLFTQSRILVPSHAQLPSLQQPLQTQARPLSRLAPQNYFQGDYESYRGRNYQ